MEWGLGWRYGSNIDRLRLGIRIRALFNNSHQGHLSGRAFAEAPAGGPSALNVRVLRHLALEAALLQARLLIAALQA